MKKHKLKERQGKAGFNERCYELLMQVPRGKVTTYKAIAEKLGSKGYRAVGNAMNRNPNAPRVPCHRVVNTDGRLGRYAFGLDAKIRILKKEGVTVESGRIADLDKHLHTFKSAKNRRK